MADTVDEVVEPSGADAADLDAWAAEDAPAATEAAKPAQPGEGEEPPLRQPAKPGKAPTADEIAAAAEKAKTGKGPAPKPAAPAKPPEKAPPYDPKAKIKITVDGEEEEITIEEALRRARKNSAADRRFQEASKLRQEAERLRAFEPFAGMYAPEDLALARDALKRDGKDPSDVKALRLKLAEIDVLRQIEAEKMSPEQRRAVDLEQENNRLKAAQQAKENEGKQAEAQRAQAAIREHYNKDFTAALTKHELPPTPYTVMRMAELTQQNLRMGLELTADEIAVLVKEDLAKEQAAYTKGLSPAQTLKLAAVRLGELKIEDVVKLLPKDFLDNLRKYDLELAKAGGRRVTQPTPKALGSVPERPRRGRTTSAKEAEKALEDWANT